jgi:hypothetical protein
VIAGAVREVIADDKVMLERLDRGREVFPVPNGGIGGGGAESQPELVRPSSLPSLSLKAVPLPDLQAEVAKSRIVEAAHSYLTDVVGLKAIDVDFGLTFGLSW